jgi:hypothetical protein
MAAAAVALKLWLLRVLLILVVEVVAVGCTADLHEAALAVQAL